MKLKAEQINRIRFRGRRNYMTLAELGLALADTINLTSWLDRRSGLLMTGDVGSSAQILPACGRFSGSSYCSRTISDFGSADFSGYVEARFYFDGEMTRKYIFGSGDQAYSTRFFSIRVENATPAIYVSDGAKGISNRIMTVDTLSVGWHTVRWVSTGTAYRIIVDGVEKTLFGTVNDGKWIADVKYSTWVRDNISSGALILNSIVYSTETRIDYVDYNGTHKWIFTGTGRYVYDVIGDLHMTWNISPSLAYDAEGSQELLSGGYSKWTASGQQDEIVPYKAGAPNDVTAFLTGYSKARDYDGSTTRHNLAPSLIEMPDATYDRSNTTIHAAAARSGYDYDALNPRRWRVEDLVDPRIYYEWRNVGYRGMIGARTENNGAVFYYISELFSYSIDKRGDDQFGIMRYNRVSNLALTSGGLPVLDGDNYVILE